jgi:hypothetical protein
MQIAGKMSDTYYVAFVFKKTRSLYIPVNVGYRESQRMQKKYDVTRFCCFTVEIVWPPVL